MAKDLQLFPDRDVKQVSLGDEGGSAGTQPKKKSAKEIMAAANEQRRIDSGQKSAKEIMAAANQQRLVDDAGRVDGAYISSFFQDAQSFLNQSQADLEGMSWASSRDQEAQANRNAKFSDLDYRAKVIGSFLENNKAGMDESAYNELAAGLDSYNSLSSETREYFDTLGKYYANFDSQEAFDADQRKGGYFSKYQGRTDEELAADLEGLEKGSNTQVTQLQAQKEALLQQGRDRLAAGAPEDEIRKLLEQAAKIDRQLQQAQSLAKDEEAAWLNDYIAYRAYLQDEAWRSKYAGKSYKELMSILEKMDGSTKEAAWLEAYAPEAMTLKEAEIMSKSTSGKEQLFYTQLYNSKLMDQKIQILSKAKMPRGRTTVLEELQNIVENNGNVSESKKDAVKAQMRKAGVDPDEWYGLLTGDGNVNAGDLVDWAGASLQSGLGSFNKSVTSTLDVLIGKPLQALGWKNNPISSAAEYYSDQYDIQAYNRQLYKDKMGGGKGFDIAESLLESTVAAVPDALLAYMTAGASTAASSAKLASNAAYQGGNILTKAGITAKNMASNPGFWTSFGRSYGSDYEEAKAMGASDTTAALCATITSLLNSSIEIGLSGNSGIQGLPQEIAEGGSKKILAWLMSSAEEGGEEVLQGFVNDLVARVSYDRSREIADLGKMAEEFGLGAGVGLILGGGQSVAASTVNAYTNREQNKKIKELYGSSVEELIQEGLEAPEGSLSHSLALQYQQRVNSGKELSGGEIAKLIAANEDAFRAEVSQEQKTPPAATPGAEAAIDTAQQGQVGAAVAQQVQPQVQPQAQQMPVDAAPMSAREAFQAEINRQIAGGNVSNLDTEALAEGVRARAAEALDSGEIDQEDYRMAMDELEQMDLEAEGRAHARANQEAQVETVWRKLGRKLGLVNENGGNANGTENYERQSEAARSYLYDGGGQRDAGTGAGGQAASMAEGPGIPQPGADTGAEAAGSADSSQSIRVSGQSLGVSRSTGEASIRMILPQAWTDEQIALAQEIQEKTGKQAAFILDTIPVRKTDGGQRQARGAFTGEKVIVQVNNREADAEQIVAHEIYHAQNAYLDGKLNEEVKAKIIERFSKEEFEAVVAEYVKALEGVYDVGSGVSEAMNKAALELIEEEVLADAYAGINAFGANAGRFSWAAWEKTNELGLGYPGKEMSRELGSGPPVESYSAEENGTNEIFPDMDDASRANILMHKSIRAPVYSGKDSVTAGYIGDLKGKYASDASKLIRNIANQCGVFDVNYYNADIDLRFDYSRRSLHESINKQSVRRGRAQDLGKMLTVLPEICAGAVEIESHTDKYTDTRRADSRLKEQHVLLGAFSDGKTVVPVQLEVKEYMPGKGMKNKLYITITIKNEAGISSRGTTALLANGSNRNTPASVYNLADLVSCVKDESGDLLKYLPDQMLNLEQRRAKRLAVEEEKKRLADMRYEYAIEQGKTEVVQRMLNDRASETEYIHVLDDAVYKDASAPVKSLGVTYDDNGSVIPLSKRYDERNQDIRYSVDESSTHAQSSEEDEARLDYFENVGAQRKQQYVEGIREAESDARLEYFEQQAELQPGEDADPEQVAREVEEMRRRSEPKPEPAEAEPVTPIAREDLPAKARDNLAREEAAALRGLRKSFGVTQTNAREFLKETVQQISNEYLATGKISQETADRLFEDAWKKGEIEDREFYDQYEHIKEKLRTTAVTLDKRDQADIADFRDFKSRSRYMLKIANEGGMPVDSLYEELRGMAPELFPESITHPADQLVRMYEAAKSIVIRKAGLDQYYGAESANMKQYAQENFDEAMSGFERKLWAVRRFVDDKTTQAEQKAQKPKVRTLEEALEAGKKMKDARRASERAVAKNLLTASDEEIVGKLLRGEMSLAQLDPSRDNVEGIRAVYEAKRAYEEAVKPIAEYKRLVHAQLRSKADGFLDTANSWKDKKSGLAYSRETMTRNIYDIVPDKALAKRILQAYFEPVQIAEAARTRFKTEMRDRVRAMKLSRNVAKGNIISEAAAVQILGEAQDSMESLKRTRAYIQTRDGKTMDEWGAMIENMWLSNPNLDMEKIQRSVEEFRKIYDELFTKMNEARVRFGYEPVSYRKGYFPHFQAEGGDGIMAFFGKALGIDTQVDVLPTTINGLTHTFKPGTTWFGNILERKGIETTYDAVEGFDRYIEGVSDVIYHTENIQNLRALASQMRYRTSEEGLQKQVDEIRKKEGLSDAEKEELIKSVLENGKYTLSNFVNELEEYTNLLANKKSKLDRTFEALVGRGRFYRFMRSMNSRVAANMVAGNVSSAMTNFIPITQAAGRVGDKNILLGMWDTMRGAKDGITEKSDFLASRRGSDVLVKTRVQKASEFVGGLMNIVDNFTSGTIVRAAYYKNLESGMSEAEALHEADVFAAGVMAGRAKGDMPTLFHSVNPLIKAFTQFQLEVNNQYSEVFKDMPRQHRGQAAYKIAMSFLGYFVRAYLFNELFELLFGRRSALDPINLLNEFSGDATGYEIPSLSSIVAGEASFKTDKKGAAVALDNLGKSALGELPFASGLTLFGFETDGGRIPVSSAIPDLSVFKDILSNDNWSPEYKRKKAKDELNKLAYVIPPFGGGQISKTWKGLKAWKQGGSYGMDSKGNELLQYPIYKDSPIEALGNALRTAVMGKSSVPEAVEWVEDGFDSFGSKQTAMYKDMLDAGVKARDAYELIDALRSAEETDSKAKKDVQLEMIRSSKISDEGKAIAVYGFIDSDSLEEVMDLLDDAGVDAGTILDVVYGYREAQLLEKGAKAAQRQVILDTDLTDSEKLLLVGELIGTDMETAAGNPTEYAKLLEAMDEGMSVDDYLKLVQAEGDIDDYLEYTEAGLSNEQALRVVDALEDLEPEAGEDSVSDMQKWREIADMPFGDDVKSMALEGMMSDSQYEKYSMALAADISTYQYINFLEAASGLTSDKDKNGKTISGSLKNKVVDLIHSMPLTPSQKDALYLSKGYAQSGLKDTPWH